MDLEGGEGWFLVLSPNLTDRAILQRVVRKIDIRIMIWAGELFKIPLKEAG